ncbi:serine/threonine protein kinase [Gorillibacterium sp. sgz5001074]|uniref:serine/threonine protein kinase n=1 Tax=Gorillibacterium sp. sgz5001074 TaxID=3446695 RepID=UPI003F66AA66
MIAKSVDGISFSLQEDHPFEWLAPLGRVFRVFDLQDSGNLSFGVEDGERRLFVKYAGARTVRCSGEPEEAVRRLKQAVQVYRELSHPSLVRLVTDLEMPGGYAAVFEWFPGENLYIRAPLPEELDSGEDPPFWRFRRLDLEHKLNALDTVYAFHTYVEEKGYAAVDFYDGSLLYDFGTHRLMVCDIDHYQPMPLINTMGRMWGSKRFMSPEEFERGAVIDGVTNVYGMGAAAFCLLGGGTDRSFGSWEAGERLYRVAARAVQEERQMRYGSVKDYALAWSEARREAEAEWKR